MKIEMAIQLSVKTSNNNFTQNLFSSSEAETSRRIDAQTVQRVHNKQNRKHSESSVTKVLQ
jgi:outer membrane lipoprotein SlyB